MKQQLRIGVFFAAIAAFNVSLPLTADGAEKGFQKDTPTPITHNNDGNPSDENETAESDIDAQDNEKIDPRDDPAFQREMAEAMFLVAIFVVAGFFLFVLILTLMRVGRHHRRRMKLGQKGEKTEYIDAWSRYTLKDEQEN